MLSVCGASAIATAHSACAAPYSRYAVLRSSRSQKRPPNAHAKPPSVPLISATVSTLALHPSATAAQRLEAAPVVTGTKTTSSARKPRRDLASVQRPFNTAVRFDHCCFKAGWNPPPALCCPMPRECSRAGSGTHINASVHSTHAPPSTADEIQGADKCCAIHSPAPPPTPWPPRLPA